MLWQDVPNTFTSIIIAVLFKKPQNNKNPQTTLEKCKLKNNPFSSLKSLKTPQSDKFAFYAGQNPLAKHPVRCYFCLESFRQSHQAYKQPKILV